MEPSSERIALFHHTGWGNLGDDAVVNAVFTGIRSRREDAEFTILSMNPMDTEKRHGIPAHPIRRYQFGCGLGSSVSETKLQNAGRLKCWLMKTRNPFIRIPRGVLAELGFLRDSYKFIQSFHYLVVTGGGQLTERGGPWSFPYALFVWSALAKRAGLKLMILSVGAGPLNGPLSRFFISRTLKRADYVSFRDLESRDLVQGLGFKAPCAVYPDNAYSFQQVPASKSTAGCIVGIAPMPIPFGDLGRVPDNAQAIQDEFITKLATFSSMIAGSGFSVRLFGCDIRSDPAEIEHTRSVVLNQHGIALPSYEPHNSIAELLTRISEMDYVVTCRLHGVVFAHLLNKPILAIAHHPKVTHLMGALGLSEYCLDMESFCPGQLFERFQSLVANRTAIEQAMAKKLAEYRAKSAEQFDMLFGQSSSSFQR